MRSQDNKLRVQQAGNIVNIEKENDGWRKDNKQTISLTKLSNK